MCQVHVNIIWGQVYLVQFSNVWVLYVYVNIIKCIIPKVI